MKPKKPSVKLGSRVTLRAVSTADPTGAHRWRLEWYPVGGEGKMKTRSLGRRGERFSQAGAEARAVTLLPTLQLDNPPPKMVSKTGRIETVGVHAPVHSRLGEIVTVGDLMRAWIGRQRKRSAIGAIKPKTFRNRRYAARRLLGDKPGEADKRGKHIPPRLRYVRLQDITEERLEDYIARALSDGDSTGTIYGDLRIMRTAYRWAQKKGRVGSRILPVVDVKVTATACSYTPTPQEVEAALDEMLTVWHKAALQMVWGTGARCGEIVLITWDRIDLVRNTVRLVGKANPRTIPITPRCAAGLSLLERGAGAARLFPGKASDDALRDAMRRACKSAGVPRFTPNGLRRLAVDELRRAGVPLEVTAAITGHSIKTMLTIYRRPMFSEVEGALSAAPLGQVVQGPWTTDDKAVG
ncbi:MAG: tyrosine-type recombinase/integrase [Myxococcota bacterium]